MGIVDIVVIVAVITGAILGGLKGLIKSAAMLAGLVLAAIVSIVAYLPLAQWIGGEDHETSAGWLRFVVFIVIFVVTNLVVNLAAGRIQKLLRFLYLAPLDHIGGAVAGAAIAFLLCAILMSVASNFDQLQPHILKSGTGRFVLLDLQLPHVLAGPVVQDQIEKAGQVWQNVIESVERERDDLFREAISTTTTSSRTTP